MGSSYNSQLTIMATERAIQPLVEMKGIVKTFGGIHALEGVNLNIYLGKFTSSWERTGQESPPDEILSGIYQPSAGEIIVDEHAHTHMTPTHAAQFGISIIYQELSVINEFVCAGEPVRRSNTGAHEPLVLETRIRL